MDRLTEKTIGCFEYHLKDHKAEVGEFGTYDAFYDYSMAIKRLGALEDITDGIPLDRLREICSAEKDGRCVVLPAKLGDMVDTRYGKGKVVAWDTTARVKILAEPDFMKRYKDFDIGSKIFTRPEAENALYVYVNSFCSEGERKEDT